MFHKFENRYIINGEIVTTTGIHIGTAMDEFKPSGNKNPFFKNAEGLPIIPGSSLKGLMRGFMQQMMLSEVGKEAFHGAWACNEAQPCVDEKGDEYKKLLEDKEIDAEIKLAKYLFGLDEKGGALCMVCRLFGSQSNGAKLLIRDAKVDEETFQNEYEMRSGVSIDRDLGISKNGQLFEVEIVPQGTRFKFQAVLENANEKEWDCVKKLLFAMKLGMLSVGGMKSRGLGGMEMENISYKKIDAENISNYLTGKNIEEKFLEFE